MPVPKGNLVAIHAFDSNGFPRTLLVDADDNLLISIDDQTGDIDVNIAAQDNDVEIVQQNPADMRVGDHGYIAAAWQKQPLQLGFSDTISGQVYDVDAPAGTNSLNSTTVPAGEIWVINVISIVDLDNAPSLMQIGVTVGGISPYLITVTTPVAGLWEVWKGSVVLAEGDRIFSNLFAVTLNDSIALRYAGIRIDVDQ